MARLNHPKISPEGYKKLGDVLAVVAASGIDMGLIHMVYLRVSQINNCPYCVDLHWRDATKAGIDARKLNALTVWRDTPFFSDQENAALEWAEMVTYMEDQDSMENAFTYAKKFFSEKQLVELTYGIAQMNAFNRIGIAFHAMPIA